VSITNAPGDAAYPISSFTWLLIQTDIKDPAKGKAVKDFLGWMLTPEAQKMAEELKYAPLPAPVVSLVQSRIGILKAGGKAIAER
jgi:phosphate transport system substrate-binding protein